MTIKNPTVINPNAGVSAQEAIAVYQGGGGTFKYGNIDLEDAVIMDNRGTSKITWYLQIADYSNLGVSNFHFTPKYLAGATHGTATEGAQYSIEEPYQQTTATPVFDASNGDPSAYFHVTLNKNVTSSTLVNAQPGQLLTFEVCSLGSFTFAWPSNVSGGLSTPTSGNCIVQLFKGSSTTTTVTPIVTSGTSTSILTGALTCGNGTFASGTLNGTPTVAAGGSIDANITAAGTAKSIRVVVTF
jgi:hypothetical protein